MKIRFKRLPSWFFALLLFLSQSGVAQNTPAGKNEKFIFSFQYCEAERARLCQNKNSAAELADCLTQNSSDLSKICQQELERYFDMRREASYRGGGALGAFGGPNSFGPPIPLVSYDGRFNPGENSSAVQESKLSLSSPIASSDLGIISASLAGGDLHINNSVTLSSGLLVPTDLYRAEIGTQFFRPTINSSYWNVKASFGYAGDQPLANSKEQTYSLNFNYGFPDDQNGKGFYILSLFISNNSAISPILPGFSYLYKSPTFTGLFGFPVLFMQWTPTYPWAYSVSLFGPTVQLEMARGLIDHLQIFSNFNWTRQSYILSQFTDPNERLYFQEMRLAIGLRKVFEKSTFTEFQLGRCFNRSLYAGDNLFDDSYGLAQVSDDWLLSLSLKHKF